VTAPVTPSPPPAPPGGWREEERRERDAASPSTGRRDGERGFAARSLFAGLGCTAAAAPAEILAALDAALAAAGRSRDDLRALSTPDFRAVLPGVVAATKTLGLPLTGIDSAALDATAARTLSPAPAAARRPMTASPAEAAALAAAGPGARLLGPRLAHGPVTVALAEAVP
jgi:cobalt-precorrin 5A hydrolase